MPRRFNAMPERDLVFLALLIAVGAVALAVEAAEAKSCSSSGVDAQGRHIFERVFDPASASAGSNFQWSNQLVGRFPTHSSDVGGPITLTDPSSGVAVLVIDVTK